MTETVSEESSNVNGNSAKHRKAGKILGKFAEKRKIERNLFENDPRRESQQLI
uniref:Uncharacterized protein n=1 Tax=Syphacia muris TaxID=451379 RepID=A0A0N5ANZ4_9BILA